MTKAKYIVIEGNDGTGKSTQVELLAQSLKQNHNIDTFIAHEPAGTPIADAIRTIIKDGSLPREPLTDLLLFTAARHEIWQQAKEAMKQGKWVLSARSFISSIAYQGYGDGIDTTLIQTITEQFIGKTYTVPDYTFILTDIDEDDRKKRIAKRGEPETPDTFEQKNADFQMRVNLAYAEIAKKPGVVKISANQSIVDIQSIIKRHISL